MQQLKSLLDTPVTDDEGRRKAQTRTDGREVQDTATEPRGGGVLTVTEAESLARPHTQVDRSEGAVSNVVRDRRMVRVPAVQGSVGDVAPQAGRTGRLAASRPGIGDRRRGQLLGHRWIDKVKAKTG